MLSYNIVFMVYPNHNSDCTVPLKWVYLGEKLEVQCKGNPEKKYKVYIIFKTFLFNRYLRFNGCEILQHSLKHKSSKLRFCLRKCLLKFAVNILWNISFNSGYYQLFFSVYDVYGSLKCLIISGQSPQCKDLQFEEIYCSDTTVQRLRSIAIVVSDFCCAEALLPQWMWMNSERLVFVGTSHTIIQIEDNVNVTNFSLL